MAVGTYFRETRPQFIVLTPMCVACGVGTAAWVKGGLGHLAWGHVVLALFGALCAHIATNVLNDYFDYTSGLDLKTKRTPFSGGSGILPAKLMSAQAALIFGLAALVMTAAIGIFFIWVRGWGILPLGLHRPDRDRHLYAVDHQAPPALLAGTGAGIRPPHGHGDPLCAHRQL